MTTTLTPDARRNMALFTGPLFRAPSPPKYSRRFAASGTGSVLVVSKMPVFRSGTFRDSIGLQHTWEDAHMLQMVDNFDLLRTRQIFSDVPVRADHPSFFVEDRLKNLIGYHTGLATEQFENPVDHAPYTYVLADFEILDGDASQKIENGLWRNVSSEVGTYLSNNEAEFWPAYMGMAYVDISAVEGLRVNGFRAQGAGSRFSVASENDEEFAVSGAGGAGGTGPTFAFKIDGQSRNAFSVNGLPAEVLAELQFAQRHITTLEGTINEQAMQARKDFVAKLVHDNKVLATLKDDTEAFALGLNPAQFAAWAKTFEGAPSQALLAAHGSTTANPDGNSATVGDQMTEKERVQDDLEVQKGIIAHHRAAGMDESKIEKLPSFAKAKALRDKLATLS